MPTDPFAPLNGGGEPTRRSTPERVAVLPVPADAPPPPEAHPQLGAPAASWTYRDAGGGLLGFVHRFELADGSKEFRPLVLFAGAKGAPRWRWESWPAPRPLYGLQALAARPEAPVVVTEGEKAADAATRMLPKHVVVASPNGAKSAAKADWRPLIGRTVTIWPDADEAGEAYAKKVAELVRFAHAKSASIAVVPAGSAAGWDAADALAEGWTTARAEALLATSAVSVEPAAANTDSGAKGGRRRPPQRDMLMDLTSG